MKLEKSFSLPTFLSVFLHGALLVLFLGNWDFFKSDEEPYKPHYVTATLVDLKPKAKAAPQQVKEQILDSKTYEDLKNNKKQEEQRRKEAEALVQSQREQQAKAAEAEKQKQQKIKEEQARAAKAKAAQAEAEKKKQAEAEAQRKAEALKKTLREQEAQAEQRRIQAARQLEAKHIAESNDEANVKSYNELLSERVAQNWSRPPSARAGMVAIFNIDMLPNGQVINVQLAKSSGNSAFDNAAEQAIKKVERFVEIKDVPIDVFERNFRHFQFAFNPEDLRQ
ncbi:cell envelope integrity protein TolA [Cellvibrio sp. OA-2007]|uniref:cell envelope integrity protein TolA n=1 Tax=Cellvibrio sp. OA-2007 TaxID=529823 RepID=UPI000780DCB6|nr:cell envelope integrity protein TolA [Cellvibrio sp. OA-2007]